MTIHPKQQRDLVLAPVAAEIDLNLQRLRDRSPRDVEYDLELELNCDATAFDRPQRVKLVLDQAVRDVEMHGWTAGITGDGCRLHLDGGSVSLDLGLSSGIIEYIRDGASVRG